MMANSTNDDIFQGKKHRQKHEWKKKVNDKINKNIFEQQKLHKLNT